MKPIVITVCVVAVGLLGGSKLGDMLNAALTRARSPKRIEAYLRSHPVRKLQIGAGSANYPDWLNTDIEPSEEQVYLDATKRFPLPDGSIQYIVGEQMVEHLTYEQGLAMLGECYRVLAPGGKIRLATPNVLKLFALYQDPPTEEAKRYIAAKLKEHGWPRTSRPAATILKLELTSFGHQFLYDPVTISSSLAAAGFKMVTQFQPGESDDPQLRGVERRHNNAALREMNDYESMVFQAVRP